MDVKEFACGTIGGMFGTALSHPLDTARIFTQTNQPMKITKLYKGFMPPLFGIGLEKSIVFGTFYSLNNNETTKDLNIFSKGMISGFFSTLVVSPVEQIKIQLQTSQYKTSWDYLKTFTSLRRLPLLYTGWGATVVREVPGYGLYFLCYENIKNKNDNLINTFWKGSVSGMFAWAFIYPSDYVKTTVQNSNVSYKTAIQTIFKNKNPLSFYKGCSYALLRCIPLHGGVFVGYELTKKTLNNYNL